jgi:hypothetical protein
MRLARRPIAQTAQWRIPESTTAVRFWAQPQITPCPKNAAGHTERPKMGSVTFCLFGYMGWTVTLTLVSFVSFGFT